MTAELPRLTGGRVAIANRGEIAVRIAATCRRLGAVPILLLGDPDLESFAARQVGRVERIGEAGSELDPALVIATAKRAGADFLHPGYGFLSERAELAEACAAAGIVFVGPSPATLSLCGDKLATRAAAERAGAPLLPASPPLANDPASWALAAERVGYPLLVKPAGAGGGRGLRHVAAAAGLVDAVSASRREGVASGSGRVVYLERELVEPRHVEVQVAADDETTLALGDRDCSLQRRHQKVIEEAPAPNLPDELRSALHEHARRIAVEVGLRGIATCEFLLGADGTLAFLEVNPRIQVEHPVTELVTGVDLVEWQLRIAAGKSLSVTAAPAIRGHVIEARVYAEDPYNGFLPATGRIGALSWPSRPNVRVDAALGRGDEVSSAYDPLLAKVIAHGSDRAAAIDELRLALRATVVAGLPTNLPWLIDLVDDEAFRHGRVTTATARGVPPTMPDRSLALLAAAAHTLDRPIAATADPWTAVGPLRMAGDATLAFHGSDWEERLTVRRGPRGWEIGRLGEPPRPVRWWRGGDDVWTIAAGDAAARMAVIEHEGGFEVAGNGGRWLMRAGPRPTAAATGERRTGDGRVRAPLPAKVLQIAVAEGDVVAQGQALLTLSAMKMELACDAPIAGTIAAVRCCVDQLVDADDILVEIEPEMSS